MRVARGVGKEEGILGGFSLGANVAAAMDLRKNEHQGKIIAFLLPDSGLKHPSTVFGDNNFTDKRTAP